MEEYRRVAVEQFESPDVRLGLVAGGLVSLGPIVGWGIVPFATGRRPFEALIGTLILYETSFAYHISVLLLPAILASLGAFFWQHRRDVDGTENPLSTMAGIVLVPVAVLWVGYVLMAVVIPLAAVLFSTGTTASPAASLYVIPVYLFFGFFFALPLTLYVVVVVGCATCGGYVAVRFFAWAFRAVSRLN